MECDYNTPDVGAVDGGAWARDPPGRAAEAAGINNCSLSATDLPADLDDLGVGGEGDLLLLGPGVGLAGAAAASPGL